jgi:hypothetical protein
MLEGIGTYRNEAQVTLRKVSRVTQYPLTKWRRIASRNAHHGSFCLYFSSVNDLIRNIRLLALITAPSCECSRSIRRCTGTRGAGRLVSFGVLMASLCIPLSGLATDNREGTVVAAPEIVIEHHKQRHIELRRALVGGTELPPRSNESRRLSPDERDTLSRELREAMQDVYDNRPRRASSQ